nr:serpin family protein [Verrucomicrobium spinosum]
MVLLHESVFTLAGWMVGAGSAGCRSAGSDVGGNRSSGRCSSVQCPRLQAGTGPADDARELCDVPYALHRVLSLVLEGAEGKTREELAQLLGWKADFATRSAAIKELGTALGRSAGEGAVTIDSSLNLLVRNRVRLEDSFLDLAQDTYGVTPMVLKSDDPANAVEGVNELISRGTRGRITNLVPPGGLGADNVLTLVSTLFFKGAWSERFPAEKTVQRPFWVPSARTDKQVKMMRKTGDLRHASMKAGGYGLLELPMGARSQDFCMLILLPDAQDGLPAVEKALTQAGLEEAIGKLDSARVTVHLPRFSFSLGGDFTMLLKALGAGRVIAPGDAELGPMSRTVPLRLSALYKETTVDVNETGAEAARQWRWLQGPSPPVHPMRKHPSPRSCSSPTTRSFSSSVTSPVD